jgi:flagellar L-ring protein FlgH
MNRRLFTVARAVLIGLPMLVASDMDIAAQDTIESPLRPTGRSAWPGPAERPISRTATRGSQSSIRQVSQFEAAPPRSGGYEVADSRRTALVTGPTILGPQTGRLEDYSMIHVELPEPPEIQKHDIIAIMVDEKSEIVMNSKFNRQKNAKLVAQLKEFMRFGETGNLTPAALSSPKIDAQLQGQLNSTGQVTDSEGIKYRIAATVTDVLPNGVIRIEARKQLQTADDTSIYTLTGDLRSKDVGPDNTASSENIANLQITKSQSGRVYDSVKRNWGYRIYDMLFPF